MARILEVSSYVEVEVHGRFLMETHEVFVDGLEMVPICIHLNLGWLLLVFLFFVGGLRLFWKPLQKN